MHPDGIRTHNLSRRAAEDLRLRPRSHWDRPQTNLTPREEYEEVFLRVILMEFQLSKSVHDDGLIILICEMSLNLKKICF